MPRSAQYCLTRSSLATVASRLGMPRILLAAESMAERLLNPPLETTLTASESATSSRRSLTSMAPAATSRTLRTVTGPGAFLVGLLTQPATSLLVYEAPSFDPVTWRDGVPARE